MFKEKKIPTILGLLLLFGGVIAGVFLTNRQTGFVSKASSSCQPKNPQITNITNNSASISFVTESSCLSSLFINNQTIENETIISSDQKSKIHYFDIGNLNAATIYTFYFIIDGKTYEESSYKFETAANPSGSIPSSNLAWGRVFIPPELKAANKVIVFLNIPGSAPLSAVVTSSGNWNVSLANSFNESKTGRFTTTGNTVEEIIVIDQDNQATQITGNTSNNNPVPDIILGQNQFSNAVVIYDTETDTGSLSSVTPALESKDLDILNPKENEFVSTQKPDFFGTSSGNSTIKIEIHSSTVYNGEVIANSDGSWNWSPPSNLEPGEHTITATTIINGVEKIITRKFTVLATDSSLTYTASSSAIPTISTPTIIPTPTTSVPTVIPTTSIISTPVPTIISTSIPTTIITSTPSTSSSMPKTGSLFPTILLFLISSTFVVFSFFSFKKK